MDRVAAPDDGTEADVRPVLRTGLRRPAPLEGALRREGLIDHLGRSRARLVLVVAPAGYGKSTLLTQWADAMEASDPVAWVNLDPADNDPLVLWPRVVVAVNRICPDLDLEIEMASAGQSSRLDSALLNLVNFLEAQGPVAFVFDDFHRITSGGARESLGWFVENLPENVRLALGSRTEPNLRIAAMRARRQVAEVRADTLRFTTGEADWLFNQRDGLALAPSDVATLVTRTEGWPAGLELAAMSLATTPDRHALVATFGASHHSVQEFLIEEVLDTYSAEDRSLMVRLSILEGMNESLADAVLEESGSRELLAHLARTNLFLIPLDDDRAWYRFHHLFGQLLRMELDRSDPGLARQLHHRAAQWFQETGDPAEAIRHRLQAGDIASASELIQANWVESAMIGRFETVQAWLDSLPAGLVLGDARLLVIQKWLFDLRGQHAEADAFAATMSEASVLPLGPQRDGFASLESADAMRLAVFPRGNVSEQVANARRVLVLEPNDSPWVALAWCFIGIGTVLRGDLAEAESALVRATVLALETERWIVAGSALAHRALIAIEAGDNILDLATRALSIIDEHGLHNMGGEASLAMARACVSTAPAEQVLAMIAAGIAGQRAWGQPTELAHGLLWAARLSLALGESGLAEEYAVQASAFIEGFSDPGTLAQELADLGLSTARHTAPVMEQLTEAELRVLALLPGRGSERDIAHALFLSFNTVHTHVRTIYQKLGVSSRDEALAKAYSLGLLKDDFT